MAPGANAVAAAALLRTKASAATAALAYLLKMPATKIAMDLSTNLTVRSLD